jgi:hypothetical protein
MGPRSRAIHEWLHAVHVVNEAGDVVETLALADNFDIADAAWQAALHTRSWSTIELRNKGRVMKRARTGGYDMTTRCMDRLE